MDAILVEIVKEMENRYENMSVRLKSILHTICDKRHTHGKHGSRILSHGLLFFALANEPWAIDILSGRGRIPSERYDLFNHASLVPCSQSLLKGGFSSLGVYVEHVRGEYIIS